MLSFSVFKRVLRYTSLLILASFGCAQESFAMDMLLFAPSLTAPFVTSSTNTVLYLNTCKGADKPKKFLWDTTEQNTQKKHKEKIIYKFNKIINNSSPKSLRLPTEIFHKYLKELLQEFKINEKNLSERGKGLLWKPVEFLSLEERIIKARGSLDKLIKVVSRAPHVISEEQSNLNVDEYDNKPSFMSGNADDFMSGLWDASLDNTEGFSPSFMQGSSFDNEVMVMSEPNRKGAISEALKYEIIEKIKAAREILDQVEDVENVLQNLMTNLKEEFPTSPSLFDSIGNPTPLDFFQKNTLPKFLSLCDAVNINAYCVLELKEESKYKFVENNLDLLAAYLNFNDKRAQFTRAQALYLKAELHRLKTDRLNADLLKAHRLKLDSLKAPLLKAHRLKLDVLKADLVTALSSLERDLEAAALKAKDLTEDALKTDALKAALLKYLMSKQLTLKKYSAEEDLLKNEHSLNLKDLEDKLLSEYHFEVERVSPGYETASQLYKEVINAFPPEFLIGQARFWSTEMRRCAQVGGLYLDSHMGALASNQDYPFVIGSKAQFRAAPANSLYNYTAWRAQPLTNDTNEFELAAYEGNLDRSLQTIDPFTPILTQDTWGEIFLLKLEALYSQINIKLSDYLPDSIAQQKYISHLRPLALNIMKLYNIRKQYIQKIERMNPDFGSFPRTDSLHQYSEENIGIFLQDLRDNYKFLKDRRFKHLSQASQLKILTRLNGQQADKETIFACMRAIHKQRSGETTFEARKCEEGETYFNNTEGKIKNEINKENCRKTIKKLCEQFNASNNEAAILRLSRVQQELETKESGFDNFIQTLAQKLPIVFPEGHLPEELNPQVIYQKIKDVNKDFEAISTLFSSYKQKLSKLRYDICVPEDQIACLLETFKNELQRLTSIKDTNILTPPVFPTINWRYSKEEALGSESRVGAVIALIRMDQRGQGRERPQGIYTEIDVAREEIMFEALGQIIKSPVSEALKSKARFVQLEMRRIGQITVSDGCTLEESYKRLLKNECSEKLKTQIKLALAEMRCTDCINDKNREDNAEHHEKKLYKAYETFHSIIYTTSLSKEIKMQGEAGLGKIIHYFPEWSTQNIPQFLRDKYTKKISYAKEVIGDTLKEAEETLSQIFPMDFKGRMALETMQTMSLFPQYSQRTVQGLPQNPEELHKKLIELDENSKIFPCLKTEVTLWLAKFAYHGYNDYHHSWDYALFLFRKICGNPDFSLDQQAIAELYRAQIYRLGFKGKEAYEPMINAFKTALGKATSEETKRIAGIYLKCIQRQQQRTIWQAREEERAMIAQLEIETEKSASSKRPRDERVEEQCFPKRMCVDNSRKNPEENDERPMNLD